MRISNLGKACIMIDFLIFSTIYALFITSNQLKPHIMNYALEQSKKVTSTIVIDVIEKLCEEENLDNKELVSCDAKDNNISTMNFDTKYLNQFLKSATQKTLLKLKEIEKGIYDTNYFNDSQIKKGNNGIVYEVPIGLVTNNIILANVHGTIPVKFSCLGSVEGNIVAKTSSFGINNALINISLNMSIDNRVIVPLASELQNIEVEIPIFMHVINGAVPSYYLGSKTVCQDISSEVKL